jgi:hypothetical protein
MSLPLIAAGAQALSGILGGVIGGRRRRREQRAAQAEFNRARSRFEALDTSNPYANITNTFENLTVNTQAAEFAAQQSQQQSANILAGLQSSAGGGGIAALAQTLANQQQQAAQAASASIAQQEQRNRMLAAQGEANVQRMMAQGEMASRQMEQQKSTALLQMAAGRKQAADEARQRATQSLVGGIGAAAGLVGGAALAGKGNIGAGFREMAGLPAGAATGAATSSAPLFSDLMSQFGSATQRLEGAAFPMQSYQIPTSIDPNLAALYNQRGLINPVM